jgi:hypothetical protein
MKQLRFADMDYENELKVGDYIVFQHYRMEETEHEMMSIEMEKMIIEEVDKYNTAFKPEGVQYYLPMYRIRQVIDEDTLYRYKGYDFNRIEMDEGKITEETFVQLKRLVKRDEKLA